MKTFEQKKTLKLLWKNSQKSSEQLKKPFFNRLGPDLTTS